MQYGIISCPGIICGTIWRDWGAGIIFGPRSFAGQDHLRARIICGPGSFAGLCIHLILDILNSFIVKKTRGEIKKRGYYTVARR